MKIQQFLEHHGLTQNPFSQEDAQSDPLFRLCAATGTHHPAWEKIYGNPGEPSTAVVFGEKGAGKTAIRLQIVEGLTQYSQQHPDERVFIVEYDDFNPFLDCFAERSKSWFRSAEKSLRRWRLWDHMDAILSLATTRLIDRILDQAPSRENDPFKVSADKLSSLTRQQKRDLLLLASFYDQSRSMHPVVRWNLIRKKLGVNNWLSYWPAAFGVLGLVVLLILWLTVPAIQSAPWWVLGLAALGIAGPFLYRTVSLLWLAWRVKRQVRIREYPLSSLREILASFDGRDLTAQPTPSRDRTDDRYALLEKLQSVLRSLGFTGMTVLVDRVDEPHLINGSAERMRDLLWPLFDNKFLKHSGLGFKLLLPREVSFFLERETSEFYERSRLDKQNMIRSLEWTGESLYDLANDRMKASAKTGGSAPRLRNWLDDGVTDGELISLLSRLRVPRHLFKFLHRLLVEHCNRYTDDNPRWQISRETLQSVFALYQRDLDAYDRGVGVS